MQAEGLVELGDLVTGGGVETLSPSGPPGHDNVPAARAGDSSARGAGVELGTAPGADGAEAGLEGGERGKDSDDMSAGDEDDEPKEVRCRQTRGATSSARNASDELDAHGEGSLEEAQAPHAAGSNDATDAAISSALRAARAAGVLLDEVDDL